jgi:hypothetical protein
MSDLRVTFVAQSQSLSPARWTKLAGGKHPARQVASGGVALETAGEIAADRGDGRTSDLRIEAGGYDLTHPFGASLKFVCSPFLTNKFDLTMALR